ncbi:mitochondrial glyco protein [Metschnikowia bicuspidata var. bicuspidata NRRL YB-4993]|uniref:Mitochondrial glyco protein n=1 Tax=Metschnikowia bicuspidata var. bicuspidata NRRL YB-4993 TaxID=869754 RepID=A0A1A0HGP3_9ASCO|nr:mitochondrial glyco protein [Metschnikowia bicuspidata var. bicuspidata NRRL YB-4993]OBA23023.1 mitochondrial glyco protein [Metschnikowia bicuspidata var. bicuspidata NRRL YB-4993]
MSRFISRVAFSGVCRSSLPQLARRAVLPISTRSFSSAVVRHQKLADIVKSEYKVAMAVDNELEPEQEKFLEKNGFSVIESEYDSNVELRKTLPSGEEIRVFFDINEVSDVELRAPEFEGEEGAEAEQFEEELDQFDNTFANVKVLVSKPESNEGIFFNLLLQNSEEDLMVDYFNYKPDVTKFLTQIKEQGTFLAATEYQGPQFSNLDESLQLGMEKYLENKGINEELADFIFAFAEVKEETAYRKLLSNVSKFLSN